ncbi:hypothetical protein A3Q56_07661 [Intoshia linei]|uniref:Uncharacterized protein n=1 Tax=Intoshia linei TaxID=1819745 RepID=A0A177ATR7_9BILA|nr:hypothetical protein A3Q56_07661 [Intoshia linei]
MTTAARPTFNPARGGSGKGENDLSSLSKQYSSRDMPAHTKLKYRKDGQNTAKDIKDKNFKRDLIEKEAKHLKSIKPIEIQKKKIRVELTTMELDADDPIDRYDTESDSDDDAALEAELRKIRKERLEEKNKIDEEKRVEDEKVRVDNIIKGNPLIHQTGEFKVKRRWDDDVVFKNCAKGISDHKKPVFINDSIRSEFHQKFMNKYMR